MNIENLFNNPLKVINVGLQSFAQDMRTAGIECQHVSADQVGPRHGQLPHSDDEQPAERAQGE